MLSAFGASGLGFHFGLAPGASVFHWACLFFGLGEWACAPIFLRRGIPNSDRHDLQRMFSSLSRGVFCLCSRTRMGLQTQSFRDLSRRRQHLPQYSDVGRRGRRRRPQFWNFTPSWAVLLNGVRSFPLHAPRLPEQRLHPSRKLSLGGLGNGRPDEREFL